MTRTVAIYARVSTKGQNTRNQTTILKEYAESQGWTVTHTFEDPGLPTTSMSRRTRTAWKALNTAIKAHKFDTLLVWAVDRLGRSAYNILGFRETLKNHGIGIVVYDGLIDTTTIPGKQLFYLKAVFAECETDIGSSRIKAGIRTARELGTPLGRPRVPPEKEAEIQHLRTTTSMGLRKIAKAANVGVSVVQRILA